MSRGRSRWRFVLPDVRPVAGGDTPEQVLAGAVARLTADLTDLRSTVLARTSLNPGYAPANWVKTVRKTAAESVASSTTYQDDDQLRFAIGASETWAATFVMLVDGDPAADVKFQITAPAGATVMAAGLGLESAATANIGSLYAYGGSGDVGGFGTVSANGTVSAPILVYASVLNASTAGFVTLQWAQRVSNATATVVRAGSFLTAEKVA